MAIFYSTPYTSWNNQPKSYWIPVRMIAHVLAYIRTVVIKAVIKVGNKWIVYDTTSERVD